MSKLFWGNLRKDAGFTAVIMAGGSGTRFWPMSRSSTPKQVLSLSPDGSTLIESTVARMNLIERAKNVLIVTAQNQAGSIRNLCPQVSVLAEPIARNTAPCIGYAAMKLLRDAGDMPMICLPADHLIQNPGALIGIYHQAIDLASREDALVTIGIAPAFPETGYGYIKAGAQFAASSPACKLEAFVEKPDLPTAQHYVESGNYFWNSGMFIWRPSVILKAFERHLPALHRQLSEVSECFGREDEAERIAAIFESIEPLSIDYGVMERADNALVFPGRGFSWSDIGSWSAWVDAIREGTPGNGSNVCRGDVLTVACENSAFLSSGKVIAGVGLDGIIVVETNDAILVCSKERAQDVKKIVDMLKEQGRTKLL